MEGNGIPKTGLYKDLETTRLRCKGKGKGAL
jgi:hypothetical protein